MGWIPREGVPDSYYFIPFILLCVETDFKTLNHRLERHHQIYVITKAVRYVRVDHIDHCHNQKRHYCTIHIIYHFAFPSIPPLTEGVCFPNTEGFATAVPFIYIKQDRMESGKKQYLRLISAP